MATSIRQLKDIRAFRGLGLVFVLVFLNMAGLMLTLTALGGLEPWSPWQFAGLLGVVEVAAGVSNVLAPNIWHLPVAQIATSRRTQVALAPSVLLIPHWGGAARAAAGLMLILVSGIHEGFAPDSLLLPVLIFPLIVFFVAVSAAIARAAVAYPESDIVEISLRWRGRDHKMEPLSLSASVQQLILGIITLPTVKMFQPGLLFGPEIRPAPEAVVIAAFLALLSTAAAALLWAGRLQWRAPPEQQREAEQNA